MINESIITDMQPFNSRKYLYNEDIITQQNIPNNLQKLN